MKIDFPEGAMISIKPTGGDSWEYIGEIIPFSIIKKKSIFKRIKQYFKNRKIRRARRKPIKFTMRWHKTDE